MKADVTTLEAKKAGTIELADGVFGLEPRGDILQRMVRYQLAKRQRGTHKAQHRGEVEASTRKIVRQKGTGGARHGSRKAPQFRGGGKAFGPRPHSHAIELPKKVRQLALKHALSAKCAAGELVVLDAAKLKEAKTSALSKAITKLGWRSALVIDGPELDANFALAARNLPNFNVLPAQGANVYDILRCGNLVLTKSAIEQLEARLA